MTYYWYCSGIFFDIFHKISHIHLVFLSVTLYGGIWVSLYVGVLIRRCPYTGEYGPVKPRILAYFMQCELFTFH